MLGSGIFSFFIYIFVVKKIGKKVPNIKSLSKEYFFGHFIINFPCLSSSSSCSFSIAVLLGNVFGKKASFFLLNLSGPADGGVT